MRSLSGHHFASFLFDTMSIFIHFGLEIDSIASIGILGSSITSMHLLEHSNVGIEKIGSLNWCLKLSPLTPVSRIMSSSNLCVCISTTWAWSPRLWKTVKGFRWFRWKVCVKRNTIKNFRDSFDPYTSSSRAGGINMTSRPSYLKDVKDKWSSVSDSELIAVVSELKSWTWLPDLGAIWAIVRRALDRKGCCWIKCSWKRIQKNSRFFIKSTRLYNRLYFKNGDAYHFRN